jgi:hypothetical protein
MSQGVILVATETSVKYRGELTRRAGLFDGPTYVFDWTGF